MKKTSIEVNILYLFTFLNVSYLTESESCLYAQPNIRQVIITNNQKKKKCK